MNGVERAITSQFRTGLPEPVSHSGKGDAESAFSADAKVLILRNSDGSLTEIEAGLDGGTTWVPAQHADEHLAYLGFNRYKGKGKSAGKGRAKRHPKEGDLSRNQKNGKDSAGNVMPCYDCGSLYHFAGSEECSKKNESFFSRGEPEYAGFAYHATDADPSPFQF